MRRFSLWAAGLLALSLAAPAPAQGRRQSPERMFKRLDTNHDGRISRDEWTRKPEAFDRLDANSDGAITLEEAEAASKHAADRAREAFATMDQNQDAQVSREEWKGTPEAFDRLDVNRNGVITREELQALRPKKK